MVSERTIWKDKLTEVYSQTDECTKYEEGVFFRELPLLLKVIIN